VPVFISDTETRLYPRLPTVLSLPRSFSLDESSLTPLPPGLLPHLLDLPSLPLRPRKSLRNLRRELQELQPTRLFLQNLLSLLKVPRRPPPPLLPPIAASNIIHLPARSLLNPWLLLDNLEVRDQLLNLLLPPTRLRTSLLPLLQPNPPRLLETESHPHLVQRVIRPPRN